MYDQNFALAGFDRTARLPDGLRLRAALREELRRASLGQIVAELADQRHRLRVLRHAVLHRPAPTPRSTARAAASITDQRQRRPQADRHAGLADRALVRQVALLAADRANVAGFGNSGRNQFRRPPVWNVDLSVFRSFPIGRFRPEFRIEAANVFNHTNWGRPGDAFTANNFMQFTPQSTVSSTAPTSRTRLVRAASRSGCARSSDSTSLARHGRAAATPLGGGPFFMRRDGR